MIEILFFISGLVFGSFANVLILRMPKGESISYPSSHCYSCKKSLKWYHNIPLFSWLILRGKCGFCGTKISVQYPLIELFCGFLFLIASNEPSLKDALSLALVFSLLLSLSLVDLRYKAVPDGLLVAVFVFSLLYQNPLLALENAMLFAGGFAMLRFLVSALLKKEAMGEADIVIAAVMGAILGVKLTLAAIYISAVFALVGFVMVRKKDFELPFIPFLSLGLFLTYIFQDKIQIWIKVFYG